MSHDRPGPGIPHHPVRRPYLALAALALAIVGVLMVALAGPGTRFGWWHFRQAFSVMRWGGWLGLAAIAVAVVAALLARRSRSRAGLGIALVALAIGVAAYALPWNWRRGAREVPPIHDITTDFADPPQLEQSVALRDTVEGMNPAAYEGDSVAALQRQAYPDIRPVMLALPPQEAYGAAYEAAREMGWEILDADPRRMTVEALDRTRWFGFEDDVVIRVRPASGISRIDIRSVSRVGRSDLGKNAERIRAYVRRLREKHPDAVADPG
ncbi:MAG TPA: DUF1499 domain-containing protein [Longimicrobium sp.]|nr:DUF1499 domain-containing protein [Longimicrobium sp.]